jgi:hypothetical protein
LTTSARITGLNGSKVIGALYPKFFGANRLQATAKRRSWYRVTGVATADEASFLQKQVPVRLKTYTAPHHRGNFAVE